MKPVNFLKAIPAHEQRSIIQWYRISVVAMGTVCAGIVAVQINQLMQLREVKQRKVLIVKQKKYDAAVIDQYNQLMVQHKQVREKQDAVNKFESARTRTIEFTKLMHIGLAHDAFIKSCAINTTQFSISVVVSSAQDAYAYRDILADSPFVSSVRITALQPYTHQGQRLLRASIVGSVNAI
jgi:hypothetical protein